MIIKSYIFYRVVKYLKKLHRTYYCKKCGEDLEEAVGWTGKYKCPNGCHPDNHKKGLL